LLKLKYKGIKMFKYTKFEEVETELTVLGFNSENEDVKVNHFDVNVVSLDGEESDIDSLVNTQDARIICEEISHEEFKTLVNESTQLNRIRDVVKENIAKKYALADEIAMMKRDDSDERKVAYEAYVIACRILGNELKKEIGYL
jgi:hypothetical protein